VASGNGAADSGAAQDGGAGGGANGGTTAPNGSGAAGGFPGQDGGGFRQGGFGGGGPGGGSGGMFGTGSPGPLRLFQSGLSGQASWLLPFAFFACAALFASVRRNAFAQKQKEALFWLAWLLPGMAFFSAAGFFHQYYLIMLAAPIAALSGAGWTELWDAYRGRGWTSYLLPVAVTATAALQWYIMQPYDDTIGKGWSIGVAAAGVLTTMVLFTLKGGREFKLSRAVGTVSILVLLIGPAYWALTPITYGQSSMLPQAGPGGSTGMGGFGGGAPGGFGGMTGAGSLPGIPGQGGQTGQDGQAAQGQDPASAQDGQAAQSQNGSSANVPGADGAVPAFSGGGGGRGGMEGGSVNEALLAYLRAHNTGEAYLFATYDYTTAAPYIIDEGEKVVAMGGFSGSDPVYSAEKLQKLVASGKLKYFLISGGRGGSSEVTSWIEQHGTEVPSSDWQSGDAASAGDSSQSFGFRGMNGGGTLYEVSPDRN
ncbi:4-amino-4-deoxy-L-arabinose transferase, partial [Paenibacillus sp. MWE-103]|nr:4-amino-4-deoxy-L-arabinose transferase [Paenibacillus artemisiicola]